jgi:hypothetical protein
MIFTNSIDGDGYFCFAQFTQEGYEFRNFCFRLLNMESVGYYMAGPSFGAEGILNRIPVENSTTNRMAYIKDGNVYLGDDLIQNVENENFGCFGAGEISYSPTGDKFLVVFQCFEGDNEAFVFNSNGTNKTRVTGEWDYMNYFEYEWDPNGLFIEYLRINSCCLVAPKNAPPEGWVRYNILTGEKTIISMPTPEVYLYLARVIGVESNDILNIRSGPGVTYDIVGTIPYDGMGIQVMGSSKYVDQSHWIPIIYDGINGWVNSRYITPYR